MAAAFECDHRAKRRRYHGETRHEHPFRTNICTLECFGKCEALSKLVAFCGTCLLIIFLQFLDEGIEINLFEYFVEGFGADCCAEHRAVLHRKKVVRGYVEDDSLTN